LKSEYPLSNIVHVIPTTVFFFLLFYISFDFVCFSTVTHDQHFYKTRIPYSPFLPPFYLTCFVFYLFVFFVWFFFCLIFLVLLRRKIAFVINVLPPFQP